MIRDKYEKVILMAGLSDDNFEELVPMIDSIFQGMKSDLDKPINTRKVLYLLREIFGIDLYSYKQVIYKFIKFRWEQFKQLWIVKIKREHMQIREVNFLRNLKGNYIEAKYHVDKNKQVGTDVDGDNKDKKVSSDEQVPSEIIVPTDLTSIKIKKMDKAEVDSLQQVAIKETKRARNYVYKGLIKKSSNNIRFNKTVYETNDLIFAITGLKQGTRFEIIKKIREYIEQHQLKSKDPNYSDVIECDEKLVPIFGNHFTFSRLRKIPIERLLKYRYGVVQKDVQVVIINGNDEQQYATKVEEDSVEK